MAFCSACSIWADGRCPWGGLAGDWVGEQGVLAGESSLLPQVLMSLFCVSERGAGRQSVAYKKYACVLLHLVKHKYKTCLRSQASDGNKVHGLEKWKRGDRMIPYQVLIAQHSTFRLYSVSEPHTDTLRFQVFLGVTSRP